MRAGVIFLKNRIEFAIRRAARCERRREQGAEVERPRFQSWWRVQARDQAVRQRRCRHEHGAGRWSKATKCPFSAQQLQQPQQQQQQHGTQCACTELVHHAQSRGGAQKARACAQTVGRISMHTSDPHLHIPDPAGCAKMQISGNRNRWYFQFGNSSRQAVPARVRPAQSVPKLETVWRATPLVVFPTVRTDTHRHEPTPNQRSSTRVLVTTPKTRNGSPAVCPYFAFFAQRGAFYRFFLQALNDAFSIILTETVSSSRVPWYTYVYESISDRKVRKAS